MSVVYKYPLEIIERQEIEMPLGADILTIDMQHKTPCLWVLINDIAVPNRKRTFRTYGTGCAFDCDCLLCYGASEAVRTAEIGHYGETICNGLC